MARRDFTSSSEISMTTSIAQNAALAMQLEAQLSFADPPEVTLKKAFSVTSGISTASSLARRYQEAATDTTLQKFRSIGRGSFGTIWEQTGTEYIYKVENHKSLPGEHLLWEELKSHKSIDSALKCIKLLGVNVHVPKVTDYITEDDLDWWEENKDKFAEDEKNTPQRYNMIQAERIFPIPQIIRDSLIDLYCPEALKRGAKASKANKDCLIRLYLGKDKEPRPSQFFSLRNFRLHKDQMESLGLDLALFAEAMGQALAVIHWIAGTDGRDIEFVLGSAPTQLHNTIPSRRELDNMAPDSMLRSKARGFNFQKRLIHIWCLDFNQVRSITFDPVGVEMCVEAFFANDPYYPRPGSTELWTVFSNAYLTTTEKALQKSENLKLMAEEDTEKIRAQQLAQLFLKGVEQRWSRKQEAKS